MLALELLKGDKKIIYKEQRTTYTQTSKQKIIKWIQGSSTDGIDVIVGGVSQ